MRIPLDQPFQVKKGWKWPVTIGRDLYNPPPPRCFSIIFVYHLCLYIQFYVQVTATNYMYIGLGGPVHLDFSEDRLKGCQFVARDIKTYCGLNTI